MGKHISRKQRWAQKDARTYTSTVGPVIYRQDAWFARLSYQVRQPPAEDSGLPSWVNYDRWLGPYRRPRNAMVELEREVTILRNRHGEDVRVGDEMETKPGPLPGV